MVALTILAVQGLRCWGLSLAAGADSPRRLLLPGAGLRAPGSRLRPVAAAVSHGLICASACEIFLDQGLNQCILRWQAASLPLSHQGSLTNSISATFHIPPPKGNEVLALFLLIYF